MVAVPATNFEGLVVLSLMLALIGLIAAFRRDV